MQKKHIPQKVIAREKIIIKLSKEIKKLKDQLEAQTNRINQDAKTLKAQKNMLRKSGMMFDWKVDKGEWDNYQKKRANQPLSKTPEWVKAGKEAMKGQPMSEKRVATSMRSLIRAKCFDIGKFLEEKNAQYGNSASNPIRVFSKADSTEQLKVRIDDKLSRLVRGNDSIESDEDVIKDLIGYLILLLIQYDTRVSSEGNA